MKITRILLLALSLAFFSCSKEDVSLTPETASSSVNLKGKGVSTSEVSRLKKLAIQISTSTVYLDKKAKTEYLIDMTKHNFSASWASRNDVQAWLTANLSLTKFTSVNQGLLAFDNVVAATKAYYVTNQVFFNDLWQATPGQIKIILDPIITDPDVPVQSTSSCDDDCLDDYQDSIDLAFDGWVADMEFGDYSGSSWHYELAEIHYSFFMQAAEDAAWNCFDNCDG